MKPNIKKAIIEMTSIIFAVLFALGVEAIYDNYQRQSEANQALLKIKNEIEFNLKEFDKQHAAVDSLIPKLAITIGILSGQIKSETLQLDLGYEQPTFQTTAWETAKLTDVIKDMEYQHVVSITQAYNELEFYQRLASELVNKFLTKDFHDPDQKLFVMKAMYLIALNLKSNSKSTVGNLEKCYSSIKESMQ